MKTKILMVCLGNICRSPMAEGILRRKLDPALFEVDSAGTANYHVGDPPDSRAVKIAFENDIDISGLRGRQLIAADFDCFDYIYTMDLSNLQNALQLTSNPEHRAKTKLILNELFPGENVEVPDPYYGNERDFRQVFALLDEVCEKIAEKIHHDIS